MAGNKKDYTQIDKCNLGNKEEEEEPQDVVYPVFKGVLKKSVIKVQVVTDRL